MWMLAAIAVLATADPPIAPPAGAAKVPPVPGIPSILFERPVKPRLLNLGETVTNEDYPDIAIRNEEQGITSMVVRIDDQGRLRDCVITASSGSAALDAQSCRVYWLRARFEPARDANGKAVESAAPMRIRWVLPEPNPIPIVPWTSTMTLRIDRAGQLKSCRVEAEAIWGDPVNQGECDAAAGAPADLRRKFRDGSSQDIATVLFENRFTPGASLPSVMSGEGKGDVLLHREAVRFVIGSDGKTSDCRTIEKLGLMPPPQIEPCKVFQGPYLVASEAGQQSRPSSATGIMTVYRRDGAP